MDQGPVDAAPIAGNEYDNPGSRPDSPEPRRREPSKPPGFRSFSRSRTNPSENHDGPSKDSTDERRRERSHLRGVSSQSTGSFSDEPMFPRVGATEQEMSGEVCVDENETHLRLDSETRSQQEGEGDQLPHKMVKFTLYETTARYWITGCDISEKQFRLLRIDRTSAPGNILLHEDETVYDRSQINDVLSTIDEGNRATGGLRKKCSFWGLLGFIRFTEAYYMVIITKRQQVAMIGGHYVYQIEDTDLVPLTTGSSSRFMRDRNPKRPDSSEFSPNSI